MHSKFACVLAIATTLATPSFPAYANPADSWIQNNVLMADPQAYCDDNVGQNMTETETHQRQNNSGSRFQSRERSQSRHQTNSNNTSGRAGFLGLGGRFRRETNSSDRQNSSNNQRLQSRFNRDSENASRTQTITSVTVGHNCSTFVEAASQRDIAVTQADAQRDIAINTNNTQRDIAGINANAEITINRDQQETMRMGIESQHELGLRQIRAEQQMFMMDRVLPNYNPARGQ